jgi:tRNA(fMet)-specific endonuclease VapC
MKYLLDTNMVSELIKPNPDTAVLKKCQQNQHISSIGSPIWHELQYGCYRMPPSRKRELVEMFLEDVVKKHLPILPYDEQAARWHAMERARLSLQGKSPTFVDGQIAAITVTNGLILITRNVDDFKGFSGLQLENWHS